MPADRLITVNLTGEGMRNQYGEYVEGEVTPIRTWATRMDKTQEDIEQEGGSRNETRRDWRIRWFAALDAAPVSLVSVVDGGQTFNVLNVIEDTGRNGDFRRRWLMIQGMHTT